MTTEEYHTTERKQNGVYRHQITESTITKTKGNHRDKNRIVVMTTATIYKLEF